MAKFNFGGNPGVASVKPQLSKMYKARLFTKPKGGGSIDLDISTQLPEQFPLGLATGWDTPFNQPISELVGSALGGNIGRAAGGAEAISRGVFGQSTLHKWMSGAVWNNGSTIEISEIPFVLVAYSNAKEEVLMQIKKLMMLVAPDETVAGTLTPPGPHLLGQSTGSLGGDEITLEIGSFLKLTPCIIESVNASFDTMFESEGTPISALVSVTVKSFWCITKQDLDNMFITLPKLAS